MKTVRYLIEARWPSVVAPDTWHHWAKVDEPEDMIRRVNRARSEGALEVRVIRQEREEILRCK